MISCFDKCGYGTLARLNGLLEEPGIDQAIEVRQSRAANDIGPIINLFSPDAEIFKILHDKVIRF